MHFTNSYTESHLFDWTYFFLPHLVFRIDSGDKKEVKDKDLIFLCSRCLYQLCKCQNMWCHFNYRCCPCLVCRSVVGP